VAVLSLFLLNCKLLKIVWVRVISMTILILWKGSWWSYFIKSRFKKDE
jgi:hypothetical protein